MVLCPLPGIAGCIFMSRMRRLEEVNRILRRIRHIQVCASISLWKVLSGSDHDLVSRNVLPCCINAVFLVTDYVVLCLSQKPVWTRGGRPFLFSLPSTKRLRLVVCNISRPVPWHRNHIKNGTEIELETSRRSRLFPKEWPFDVSVRPPIPAIITPVFLLAITTVFHKLIKFTVRYHVFTSHETRNIQSPFTVFIIPTIRREICRLS
mmetsp:Transcript_56530/g.137223  ORF Transcript_56530/g.137223 Transcript_56530/m.137223 type:complete len:207 (+) Transcript_56530:1174-1794(+)